MGYTQGSENNRKIGAAAIAIILGEVIIKY